MKPHASRLLIALAMTAATASAQNDECATALPIGLGMVNFDTTTATTSLPAWPCGTGGTDLWYRFTAPNAGRFEFNTCGSLYDTVLQAFSGSCASLTSLACNDDSCGLSSRVETMLTAGQVIYVRVGGFNSTSGTGTLTALEIVPAPLELIAHYRMDDTAATCVDSSGNNLSGVYLGGLQGQPGAAVGTGTSVDFDGSSESVEISGDPLLDQLINDLSAAAWINVDAFAPGTGVMRIFGNSGFGGSWSFGVRGNVGLRFTTHAVLDYDIATPLSTGTWVHVAVVMDIDNDVTFYVNGAPIGQVLGTQPARTPNPVYRIAAWNPPSAIPEYFNGRIDDVQVYRGALTAADVAALFNNPGSVATSNAIGTAYCHPAVTNSTGQPGLLTGSGSTVAASNDVELHATQLPPNAFGYFLNSRTQGNIPNPSGSQGVLCLGGSIGRYVLPGQIMNAGAAGEFLLVLNLPASPTPTGAVAIVAGEVWNFQAWYRDANPNVTSNFTNGLTIQFQ